MIHYFFRFIGKKQNPEGRSTDYYQFYALIDEKYYWTTEWFTDTVDHKNVVEVVNGGFVTDEITERCKKLSEVDFSVLRTQLGSFAYFIERAVNGFKSYIIWISPDPQLNDIPWQIMNN
jgi:hypothetical protein